MLAKLCYMFKAIPYHFKQPWPTPNKESWEVKFIKNPGTCQAAPVLLAELQFPEFSWKRDQLLNPSEKCNSVEGIEVS